MKYMLIHVIDPTAEHGTDGMPACDSWLEDVLARGVSLHGDRLRGVDDATTVQVRDREVLISDGPFAETKEIICGYDMLECTSLEEAVRVAAAHPVARFGKIEVREVWTL